MEILRKKSIVFTQNGQRLKVFKNRFAPPTQNGQTLQFFLKKEPKMVEHGFLNYLSQTKPR